MTMDPSSWINTGPGLAAEYKSITEFFVTQWMLSALIVGPLCLSSAAPVELCGMGPP